MRPSYVSGKINLETIYDANIFLCLINPVFFEEKIISNDQHLAKMGTYYALANTEVVTILDGVRGWELQKIVAPISFDRKGGKLSPTPILGAMLTSYLTQDGFILTRSAATKAPVHETSDEELRSVYEELVKKSAPFKFSADPGKNPSPAPVPEEPTE